MRKSYFAIIALGALVIASCQKENSADLPKVDSPVFTATLDGGSDTKTVLNGKKSHWESGDAIRVLNEKGGFAVYTTENAGATATFTTTTEGFTGEQFLALYPANESGSATWKADYPTYINGLRLSPIQTAKEGSYDSTAHLAYAYADGNSLLFKNMVALLKFTIAEGSNEVSSISVSVPTPASGNTGYLAGYFTYDTNSSICYNEGGSLSATVALTGTFVAGQTYYMAVLPGTYASLTLKVNDKEYKTKSTESVFAASKVYDLGSIDVQDEQQEVVMTIDKQNSWADVYVYAWDSSDNKIFGAWPGTKVEGNTVKFPKTYYKGDINFILSTEIATDKRVQTKNQSRTLTEDFSFTLPSDKNTFVCLNTSFWAYDATRYATNVYAWTDSGTIISGNWPGATLKDHDVYSYKCASFDPELDLSQGYNFILNCKKDENDRYQTDNLTTGNLSVTNGTYYRL